jgi:hypothetical protein
MEIKDMNVDDSPKGERKYIWWLQLFRQMRFIKCEIDCENDPKFYGYLATVFKSDPGHLNKKLTNNPYKLIELPTIPEANNNVVVIKKAKKKLSFDELINPIKDKVSEFQTTFAEAIKAAVETLQSHQAVASANYDATGL